LDSLIDESLLAQAAQEEGFQLSDADLQTRIDALAEQAGGAAALDTWMQANGYDAETFRRSLQRSIAAAWMRDQIITAVPTAAEQVHARQILIYNADEANEVYTQLQAGNSFANLAVQYDPVARGDLGWFPRGYLTDPKLDDAVFPLEINQYTPVIETAAGFHILQLLERDPARPLSPEALLLLQARAVQEWLQQARSAGQIEVLLP
jgi:parvulin-like peptidyl-prolyl isomerase